MSEGVGVLIMHNKSSSSGNLNPHPSASRAGWPMDMYFSTWPKLLLCVLQARGFLLSWVRLRENGEKTQLKLFVEPTTAWCTCIFDWRKLRSSGGFCHGVTSPVIFFLDLSDAFSLQNRISG